MNKVAKARENPTEEAVECFGIFRDILLKSSDETHLKLAASSPVMDTIQKYINLSFVIELQDECVLFMISAFKNKKYAYDSFSSVTEESGEFDNFRDYLHRHPEFQQVYQKYKNVYEKNFM